MQKLGGYLDAKNLAEAEKVADSILKMISANAEPSPPTDPVETMHKRITGKVERITEGVQKWAASGRDPSAILKTMQEKVGPLLDAGKVSEAEPELDRVLEQLGQPTAEAQDKEHLRPTMGPAPPGSVWYTVGNLSVHLLSPRLGFADRRTDAQVQPPSGALAEGADQRPGARRAPIAGRTAHATDEYPAIRGSRPHARPDARARGATG